ncbi:NUDIX domain-containing protein [Microvirga thermotolerans]|uniref:NUDIX domain-containing protein n=1 Tax=Microvirga thermotolerans TaxID=2651334 RepID=A0A5P9JX89_9HYPH|nr:NUDIX domain-containing protein [Microvirga thermotolerans]QFU16030.1 NUDIX domain-containing protein [Microvirga thermotolerans]
MSPVPVPSFHESYLGRLRGVVGDRLLLMPGSRIVIEGEGGRVLLQRRSDFGVWGIPGGVPEEGEGIVDAIVRETREETGLTVLDPRPFGYACHPDFETIRYPNGHVCQYFSLMFCATSFEGALGGSDGESLELAWFAPESLPSMLPNMRRSVEAYVRFKTTGAFQMI